MVIGGEVVTIKSLEEESNLAIAEMPINVSSILLPYSVSKVALVAC